VVQTALVIRKLQYDPVRAEQLPLSRPVTLRLSAG
jgi:hypothetical protein